MESYVVGKVREMKNIVGQPARQTIRVLFTPVCAVPEEVEETKKIKLTNSKTNDTIVKTHMTSMKSP